MGLPRFLALPTEMNDRWIFCWQRQGRCCSPKESVCHVEFGWKPFPTVSEFNGQRCLDLDTCQRVGSIQNTRRSSVGMFGFFRQVERLIASTPLFRYAASGGNPRRSIAGWNSATAPKPDSPRVSFEPVHQVVRAPWCRNPDRSPGQGFRVKSAVSAKRNSTETSQLV